MQDESDTQWEEIDHDAVSGRRIFKADVPVERSGNYGTYYFEVEAKFEVRNADDEVLFKTSGTAAGEHWCGVFLWFIEDSQGRRVRLDESDSENDEFCDVPDVPISRRSA